MTNTLIPKAMHVYRIKVKKLAGIDKADLVEFEGSIQFYCAKIIPGEEFVEAQDCFVVDYYQYEDTPLVCSYKKKINDLKFEVQDCSAAEFPIQPWMNKTYEQAETEVKMVAESPFGNEYIDALKLVEKEILKMAESLNDENQQ